MYVSGGGGKQLAGGRQAQLRLKPRRAKDAQAVVRSTRSGSSVTVCKTPCRRCVRPPSDPAPKRQRTGRGARGGKARSRKIPPQRVHLRGAREVHGCGLVPRTVAVHAEGGVFGHVAARSRPPREAPPCRSAPRAAPPLRACPRTLPRPSREGRDRRGPRRSRAGPSARCAPRRPRRTAGGPPARTRAPAASSHGARKAFWFTARSFARPAFQTRRSPREAR